jgi:hypothetical protein
MRGNIILAVSNLYGLFGVAYYYKAGMYYYCSLLLASVLCAVVRHLIEQEDTPTGRLHHGMPGVGWKVSQEFQQGWAEVTVAIDLLLALSSMFILTTSLLLALVYLAIGLLLLALPEVLQKCCPLHPQAGQLFYIVSHSLGHLFVYHTWNMIARCMLCIVTQQRGGLPPLPC